MSRLPFIDQHPVWFVLFLEIGIAFVYILVGTAAPFLGLTFQAAYGVSNVILVILAVFVTTLLGWWMAIGFHAFEKRRDAWFFLVPLIPVVVNIIPGVKLVNLHHVVVVFFTALSAGFVEEVFFRGLMLKSLRKVGTWFAIIATTLLCGSIHGINAIASKNILDTLGMVLNGLAVGILFSSLVIKKGVIWPLVIAHFLTDFFFLLRDPAGLLFPLHQFILTVFVSILLIVFGVWLMIHPVKPVVLVHETPA